MLLIVNEEIINTDASFLNKYDVNALRYQLGYKILSNGGLFYQVLAHTGRF